MLKVFDGQIWLCTFSMLTLSFQEETERMGAYDDNLYKDL